ncbi:DNA-binding protein [Pseudomonas sp. FP1742]|uniref:DNA-binding protein n=1 Tax=Pseudomonas sp. FP1742 TaxID=2954079 RepID=UPI0027372173|nr:DNA-binding protein [Pseudomonas sp. FP1742]WLG48116.1 DNA-binding protein [Pseudomonas sp. FP1742]
MISSLFSTASLTSSFNVADFDSENSDTASSIASLLSDVLLEKKGSGATFDKKNPLVTMVAEHMDKNPEKFGKPDDATGSVNGWKDELEEDDYLSGDEKKAFAKGLESLIQEMLGGSVDNSDSNSTQNASGSLDTNDLLSALLGDLGEETLDNLLKPTGDPVRDKRGEVAFQPEDKDVLKEVARFMDMHPEEFGKPDGKSKDWMGELSEGDTYMSRAEGEQFQKAIDMIKGQVKDNAQGNALAADMPNSAQNFLNGGAGNTLQTDASIAAGNVLSVLVQQSSTSARG